MREPTFLLGLAIAGVTLIVIVRTVAGAFTARRGRSEVAELKEQLDQYGAELEEAQRSLADLHNRLDFAERLLAQQRERAPLGSGDKDK